MKKIISLCLILIFSISLTSCNKTDQFFTEQQLNKYYLSGLTAPENSSNYYNKSNNLMLTCYMNVNNDDDVRNFVENLLQKLDNNDLYEFYGYTKNDDTYKKHRNIYLSKSIDDYLVNSYNYSSNSVSFNSYDIYFQSKENKKRIINVTITSYTEQQTNYLRGYNLYISIIERNAANYFIININE